MYKHIGDAHKLIQAIRPRVSIEQANYIASLAENAGDDAPVFELGIKQFKREYTVRGGKWIVRKSLLEEIKMPYENVPENLQDKMESCVQGVMKEGKSKESAIAICYTTVVGEAAKESAKGTPVKEMEVYEMPEPVGMATTFADLRAMKSANEAVEELQNTVAQFGMLAQNIIDSPAEDKPGLLKALANEFVTIVQGEVATMQAEEPAATEAPEVPAEPEAPASPELPPEEVEAAEQGARINSKMLTRLSDARKALDDIISWGSYTEEKKTEETPPEEAPKEEVPPEEEQTESFAESVDGAGITLSEAVTESDGGRRAPVKLDVALIKPGWGNKRDNHYYPKETLLRDAKVFEGAKMYATDHRADEKSVRTEVSRIERIKGFTDGGSPIAEVVVFEPDFAEMVRNRADAGLLNTLECSILASGKARTGEIDGVKGKIVESITSAQSVDWVTKAGAGGQALQLSEAAPVTETAQQVEQLSEEVKQNETVQEVQEEVKESVRPQEKEEEVLSEADINSILSKSVLPHWAQEWLREDGYKNAEELEAAITRAIPRVKKATRSGEVFGQGESAHVVAREADPEEIEERKKKSFNRIMKKYGAREV